MSTEEEEINPYELLKLESEATEQDIKTAYRKISLKVHPDRNPNNPEAARLFHELNQAYELLLDPLRRLALDQKLRVKRARAERYKSYDKKRKDMLEELEGREREFKKAKVDNHNEKVRRELETERIKEEGRRLREQKEKEREMREEEQVKPVGGGEGDEMEVPELHPLDTTVRLKYSLKIHPELTTSQAIGNLLAPFGATDTESIVLSLKAAKKSVDKRPRAGTALVPFKQIGDAFAAVCASGRVDRGLEGVDVGWVNGKEPQILGWLKKIGKLGSSTKSPTPPATDEPRNNESVEGSAFSTFPSTFPDILSTPVVDAPAAKGIDFESLTLMRMREAERARLEREIVEQEAAE